MRTDGLQHSSKRGELREHPNGAIRSLADARIVSARKVQRPQAEAGMPVMPARAPRPLSDGMRWSELAGNSQN